MDHSNDCAQGRNGSAEQWVAQATRLYPVPSGDPPIFLHRESGVQVWATDLGFSASEKLQRIRNAGVADGVFPIHANARSLPLEPLGLTVGQAGLIGEAMATDKASFPVWAPVSHRRETFLAN